MESKNNWKAWLYLAPTIILLSVFTFYPIINTFVVSFTADYDYVLGSKGGFTFQNYIEVLSPNGIFFDDVIKTALPNTLLLTFVTVPVSIILSLAIAIGLNSIKALKKIFQTVFFMPYVTNAIAIGMVFSVIFDTQYGLFNAMFGIQGHPWITMNLQTGDAVNYWSAFFAICFYIVWHSLPYKILIFLGGLQNVDNQYYDAAKIDGASRFKTIMKVTIPLLSPQILYIMITSFIGAFKEYNSVIGLFGKDGGTFDVTTGQKNMQTIVYFIYDQISENQVQYASAAAVLLFILILIFTGIQFKVSKRRVHY
ncbi:MAG: sugar ABC transporter permease [Mollicutes bacterium]|nr:sugar ABC transporter permease [Mollicutes bacterium]MDD7043222.1 sugar ABC transporter permease [Mollicutes bacterium]MDY6070366.1 sugar ABC transporter permease [Bacilli bacterium]